MCVAISLEQLLTSCNIFHMVGVGGDAREPIGILAITNTQSLSLVVLLGLCYVSCIHGICPCSNNLENYLWYVQLSETFGVVFVISEASHPEFMTTDTCELLEY